MIGILKKLKLPTGETKEVDALESWTVSWRARTGDFSGDWETKTEVFIDEQAAKDFAKQLENAKLFLRDTWSRQITVKKN